MSNSICALVDSISARLAASRAFQALLVGENSAAAVHLLQLSKRSATAEEVIATPQFQSLLVRDTPSALAILDIFKNDTHQAPEPGVSCTGAASQTASQTETSQPEVAVSAQRRLLCCSGCGIDKAISEFSNNQLYLRDARKCKRCIEQEIVARQHEQRERARAERHQLRQEQPHEKTPIQQQQQLQVAAGASYMAKSTQPKQPDILRCSHCNRDKKRSEFSKTQLTQHSGNTRKCKGCVAELLEEHARAERESRQTGDDDENEEGEHEEHLLTTCTIVDGDTLLVDRRRYSVPVISHVRTATGRRPATVEEMRESMSINERLRAKYHLKGAGGVRSDYSKHVPSHIDPKRGKAIGVPAFIPNTQLRLADFVLQVQQERRESWDCLRRQREALVDGWYDEDCVEYLLVEVVGDTLAQYRIRPDEAERLNGGPLILFGNPFVGYHWMS